MVGWLVVLDKRCTMRSGSCVHGTAAVARSFGGDGLADTSTRDKHSIMLQEAQVGWGIIECNSSRTDGGLILNRTGHAQ